MYTYQVCIQHSIPHALDIVHTPACMQTIFSMICMHISNLYSSCMSYFMCVCLSLSLQHPLDRSRTITNIYRTYRLKNNIDLRTNHVYIQLKNYIRTMYV